MFQETRADIGRYSALLRQFLPPLLALILASVSPLGFSQDPTPPASPAEVEALTQDLAALNARYRNAGPAERPGLARAPAPRRSRS